MSVGNERDDTWKELTQKNIVEGDEATWDKYESCDNPVRECSTYPTNLHRNHPLTKQTCTKEGSSYFEKVIGGPLSPW